MFYGSDFVTLTKSEDATWDILKPEIFAVIMDFYSSGQALFLDAQTAASKDTAITEVWFDDPPSLLSCLSHFLIS